MKMENIKIENEKKTEILLEALPYISKFQGKVFVIKVGGSILQNTENIKSVIEDIVFLTKIGIKVVVIHGGGKDINEELKIHNIEPKFVDGIRFTDDKTMEVVEMVLSGKVNKNLVREANNQGMLAVGVSGKDGGFIIAEKQEKFGNVGKNLVVNANIIATLLEKNFTPFVSPVCCSKKNETLNANADDVAVAVAKEMKAEKLIFLTDIDGVYEDVDNKNSLISVILAKNIQEMIDKKVIVGGMIPKIKSCGDAVKNGIKAVHIINGNIKHSMLLEIYTNNGIGTIIKNG